MRYGTLLCVARVRECVVYIVIRQRVMKLTSWSLGSFIYRRSDQDAFCLELSPCVGGQYLSGFFFTWYYILMRRIRSRVVS